LNQSVAVTLHDLDLLAACPAMMLHLKPLIVVMHTKILIVSLHCCSPGFAHLKNPVIASSYVFVVEA
jgi:hypothetical protein